MNEKPKEPTKVGSFDVLQERAISALSMRNYQAAEVAALQAQSLQPNHPGVLNLLGQIWLAQNRYTDAVQAFSSAVAANPNLANLRFNLALAHQGLGQFDLAIEQLIEATRLDPKVSILHAKLGQLLMLNGSPSEAVTVLRHAVRLDPKPMPPRINLAQGLADCGEIDEAETIVSQLLKESPREPSVLRISGSLLQMKGEFQEASERFEVAIALRPLESANYLSVTQCRKMEASDSGLVDQMMRLCVQPGMPEKDKVQLAYAIGKSLDDIGQFESAFRWFQRANEMALLSKDSSGRRYEPELTEARTAKRIQLHSKEVLDSRSKPTASAAQTIFIVGMIRSGTTLVEQILSRHPDVTAGGEIAYWAGRESDHTNQFAEARITDEEIASWRQEYDSIPVRAKASSAWITDKMPLNFRAIGSILAAYPDAKIIHCRRHPVDTCLSIYLTPYRSAPEFAHDLDNIAHAYREYLKLMEHWRSVLPANQLIEVDYEALVKEPSIQIPQLIADCGLTWFEECLDPQAGTRAVQTPSIWQVRQPIHQGSVGRWKNYAPWIAPLLSLEQV